MKLYTFLYDTVDEEARNYPHFVIRLRINRANKYKNGDNM